MRAVYKPPWLFLPGLGAVVLITAFEGHSHPALPVCAALAFFTATVTERVDHHRRKDETGKRPGVLPLLTCTLALLAGVLLIVAHVAERNVFYLGIGCLTTLFSAFFLLLGVLTKSGEKKKK